MTVQIVFFIVLGCLAFGFALAVQMRVMIALVLRRALKAWDTALAPPEVGNAAIKAAAALGEVEGDSTLLKAVSHLRATYPLPLSHLQTARRACWLLPAGILIWLALGRFIFGAIA